MSKGPKKISTRPIVGKTPKRVPRPRGNARQNSLGLDRIKIRLGVFMLILVAAFVALFSRLWFLQVLASDEYRVLARENRVRRVDSEPPRGRILDRNGVVLVDNRPSLSVTMDRQVIEDEQVRRVLRRLSRLLDVKVKSLASRLRDNTVSPYKPIAVANDVTERQAERITVRSEFYPGVGIEVLPIREYPQNKLLAQVLGYTGEIPPEDLKGDFAKGARPVYQPGDIIGRAGIERVYDRWLRGRPRIEKVVVDSVGNVVGQRLTQEQRPGNDLYLSVDVRLQKLAERALKDGIMTARSGGYAAPDGGVVVMDPRNGEVIAMTSYPTYNPAILADGFSTKDEKSLGGSTPTDPQDDALVNRAIAAEQAPGSTFKVVTGGAALATDVIGPYDYLDCPGSRVYPPEGGPGSVTFFNWTTASQGSMGFPEAIETSCNTFFYELGWQMEARWGEAFESADGSERFQKYERTAGFDEPTGIDLPYEQDGVVPDMKWCKDNEDIGYCPDGWLPGYTVNMSIGQGDLKVTPIQMAVTYAAVANGGSVWTPRIGMEIRRPPTGGEGEDDLEDEGIEGGLLKRVKEKKRSRLPLDETEIQVLREGLEGVISGSRGTAAGAFSGFPLDRFPLAGKTGTAQRGETGENDAWFISYGPADDPRYVISVYVERAGHGGTTAAPIARQIWEGIAALEGVEGLDTSTDVSLSSDNSG